MQAKKICSIGKLSININISLTKEQSDNMNFDLESYKEIEDLKSLLYPDDETETINNNSSVNVNKINLNIMNFVTLSSDNQLLNTLLYINRVYKKKTFIEFIMPNQLQFDYKRKFIYNFLNEVLSKNYVYIVGNKILDFPSDIKLIIKILKNENSNEIEAIKNFDLFEGNDMDIEQINVNEEKNKSNINFFNEIAYNFFRTDYFLLDLKEIKRILSVINISIDSIFKNISDFLLKMTKTYSNIKIILIIDENLNQNYKNSLIINKSIINSADIIFSFKNNLNKFLQTYYTKSTQKRLFTQSNKNLFIKSSSLINYDIISKDFEKYRKNIKRHTVIFEDFSYIHIYDQDIESKKNLYDESFTINLMNDSDEEEPKNIKNQINDMNAKNFIYNNANKLYHIFIGGYLSRYINGKNFETCFKAANVSLKIAFKLLYENKEFMSKIDDFNIKIPISKSYLVRKKEEKMKKKEKNFILDGVSESQKNKRRTYDSVLDSSCYSRLTFTSKLTHSKKDILMKRINELMEKKKIKDLKCIVLNEGTYYYQKYDKYDLFLPKMDNNNPITLRNDNKIKYNTTFENSIKRKINPNSYNTDLNVYKYKSMKKWKTSENFSRNVTNNGIDSILTDYERKISPKIESYSQFLFRLNHPKKDYEFYTKKYYSLGKKK